MINVLIMNNWVNHCTTSLSLDICKSKMSHTICMNIQVKLNHNNRNFYRYIVDHSPSPTLPHSHSPTLLFKPLSFPPHFPLPLHHPPPPLNRPILLFLLPSWSLQLTLRKRKQKQMDFLCKRKNITQWQMTAKLCAINP